MIADTDGYNTVFDIHQGKFEQVPGNLKPLGLGECEVVRKVDHANNEIPKVCDFDSCLENGHEHF